MSVDLSAYRQIQPALFVRLDIEDYAVLRFSDFNRPYILDGELYSNLGSLLSVGSSASEIRASASEINIVISGIPAGTVSEILDNNPKGSAIQIKRGFFDPITGEILPVAGNPAIKFLGLVSNYAMDEDWDFKGQQSTFTITLICSSVLSVLKNKVVGRRTNPYDEDKFYPGDSGMNRVPTVVNTNFQFGAPPGTLAALN
jgi:hypothetical protein